MTTYGFAVGNRAASIEVPDEARYIQFNCTDAGWCCICLDDSRQHLVTIPFDLEPDEESS